MKEIMVKQPVKVDHTEVCPGISEIFFFLTEPGKQKWKIL